MTRTFFYKIPLGAISALSLVLLSASCGDPFSSLPCSIVLSGKCWTKLGPDSVFVLSVAEVGGQIWIGTDRQGILRYDPGASVWKSAAFPGKTVRSLVTVPGKGQAWATVNGAAFPDTTLSYLYLTTTLGANWSPMDGGFAAQQQYYSSAGPLAIDPSSPERLLLSTAIGVALSEDGGGSWRLVLDTRGTVLAYDAVGFSPVRSRLWAGGANLALGDQRLMRSDDDGGTWIAVTQPGPGVRSTIPALLTSFGPPDRVAASIVGSVRLSDDAGQTWRSVLQTFHPTAYVNAFLRIDTLTFAVSDESPSSLDGLLGVYLAPSEAGPWTRLDAPLAGGATCILAGSHGEWFVGTKHGVWLIRDIQ